MNATAKRVFWTDAEKNLLAAEMAAVLAADPKLSMLSAVRQAQLKLPENRRRDIITWAIVSPALQPLLIAAQEALAQGRLSLISPAGGQEAEPVKALQEEGAQAPCELPVIAMSALTEVSTPVSSEMVEPEGASLRESITAPVAATSSAQLSQAAPEAPTTRLTAPSSAQPTSFEKQQSSTETGLNPLALEGALLAALSSPVLEKALTELFGRAMAQAFSRMSAPGASPEPASSPVNPSARILLAGFSGPTLSSLENALSSDYEVRVWRSNQSPQMFEALVKICPLVVVPEEMSDEVDEVVKPHGGRILRFQGRPQRLLEQVSEMMSV